MLPVGAQGGRSVQEKIPGARKESVMLRHRTWAWVCAALAAVLLACGQKAEEKASEKAAEKIVEMQMAKEGQKVDVDLSKGSVKIESKEGDVTVSAGEGVKVPDGFPKDVFVHEGTVKTATTEGGNFMLAIETEDGATKVAETYKEKLKSEGWQETRTVAMEGGSFLEYEKDGRSLTVHLMEDDGKTLITVAVQKAE
jgi:hypothetical protein